MANAMEKIITASLPYNRAKVIESMNKLSVEQVGHAVMTSYDDRLLKEAHVSDKYLMFDFPKFVGELIPRVENYFTPSNYLLRMIGGRQELRLIGEQMKINGEVFYRMLSILNSTDKSRALQMNMGLMRLICTNGMFASVDGEVVSIRGKHYKNSLPDKIEGFSTGIERFKSVTDEQRSLISDLLGTTVSYRTVANALVRNADNEVVDSKLKKLTRLAGKLLTSDTDRLKTVSEEQLKLLNQPDLVLYHKDSGDLELDAYRLFNCYTEIFRANDSGKIKRESDRILDIIAASQV